MHPVADTPDHAALQQRLEAELVEVEARFAAELTSDLPCVNELIEHVERYRGKMLRPMLVVAAGLAAADQDSDVQPAAIGESHRVLASVVEMVHMATLVHDDVLDEADTRRRGGTVNRLHGNETAVMLGDYLISHAYHLCASLQDQSVSRRIAATTNTVCEGELLQLANRGNWSLDEPTYFEIIRRKTASLCGTCCALGVELAGGTGQTAQALYHFGEDLGLAFQIVDDLLDLTGEEGMVGKTLGRDLDKGKLTLPLIHALHSLNAAERRQLTGLLQEQAQGTLASSTGPGPELLALAHRAGSLAYARERAQQLVVQATDRLESIQPSTARRFLSQLAAAVLSRQA